jgi:uncharacterized membrane protein SirB2
MLYYWIKNAHLATVTFNIGFFMLRYFWMLNRSPLVQKRIIRRISQFNDTLLLLAGISMAILSSQYPFQSPWLTAKLIGLLVYIILGTLALRRARSHRARTLFGILALLTVGYIVLVATYRTPEPWALLGM